MVFTEFVRSISPDHDSMNIASIWQMKNSEFTGRINLKSNLLFCTITSLHPRKQNLMWTCWSKKVQVDSWGKPYHWVNGVDKNKIIVILTAMNQTLHRGFKDALSRIFLFSQINSNRIHILVFQVQCKLWNRLGYVRKPKEQTDRGPVKQNFKQSQRLFLPVGYYLQEVVL